MSVCVHVTWVLAHTRHYTLPLHRTSANVLIISFKIWWLTSVRFLLLLSRQLLKHLEIGTSAEERWRKLTAHIHAILLVSTWFSVNSMAYSCSGQPALAPEGGFNLTISEWECSFFSEGARWGREDGNKLALFCQHPLFHVWRIEENTRDIVWWEVFCMQKHLKWFSNYVQHGHAACFGGAKSQWYEFKWWKSMLMWSGSM